MQSLREKIEKISDCFYGVSTLFENIKSEFEALESKIVPKSDAVTQTELADFDLTEDEEKNFFVVGHELIQDTQAVIQLDNQIVKFQILKESFNQPSFHEDLIDKTKEKKKIIENDMEAKRKTRIPNLPEIFEKKLISFFQDLPDGDMSKPINVLFKAF